MVGVMLANDEEQLAITLRGMDLYLVRAEPDRVSTPIYLTRPVNRRELINFTTHLVTAIKAGIYLTRPVNRRELINFTTHLVTAIKAGIARRLVKV